MMQEMVGFWDGSGISWTICKQSAPCSRQISAPTPITQFLQAEYSSWRPTNSVKHWRQEHWSEDNSSQFITAIHWQYGITVKSRKWMPLGHVPRNAQPRSYPYAAMSERWAAQAANSDTCLCQRTLRIVTLYNRTRAPSLPCTLCTAKLTNSLTSLLSTTAAQ